MQFLVEPVPNIEGQRRQISRGYLWAHKHQQQQATEPAPQPLLQSERYRQPGVHSEGVTFSDERSGGGLATEESAKPETVHPTDDRLCLLTCLIAQIHPCLKFSYCMYSISKQERGPRETLTYKGLGQPIGHAVDYTVI